MRGAERRVRRGACAVQSRGAGAALAIARFRLDRGPTGGCWNGCWLRAATRAWVFCQIFHCNNAGVKKCPFLRCTSEQFICIQKWSNV
ncbi:pyridoxal phosphate phosphatase PHOSPHO2 isoform X2 [Microtus pennsylvanicus]|uniref:pyridoxal phosphate phosphatase PHOSPHO2 isoform X2 n=1 Tax=Microtus pennsylvanicus TaxID=10058 RepID=UPI003F6BAC0A